MADTTGGRSSREIRRTIELTRADMHETVDALEQKLSPGQLVDEMWDRLRTGPGSSLSSMGSAMGELFRDHPMPAALMGMGVAWLAVERATDGPARGRDGTPARENEPDGSGRGNPARQAASAASTVKDAATGAARSAGGAARSAGGLVSSAGEKVTSAARSAGSKVSEVGSRVGDRASSAGEAARDRVRGARMKDRGRKVRDGMRSTFEEQPLALAAAAFGLGLAGALAAPSSRREDSMMGEASDTLKEEAGAIAGEAGEEVKEMAEDTMRAAREEAEPGRVAEDVKREARDAAARMKDEARE